MNNTKITIVTNTFGQYHRQDVAVDSLRHLRQMYPENVDIMDLQFVDDSHESGFYEDIPRRFFLTSSARSILGDQSVKKLPVFFEILHKAFTLTESDYVVYVNSDVILLPKVIEYILQYQPDCLTGPRLDIADIPTFQHVLDSKVTPVRCEIAGYDFFVFKRSWFESYGELLNCNYFIGKPLFDVVCAGIMVLHGGAKVIYNVYPMMALHIFHGPDAVITDCPEKTHNESIMKSNVLHQIAKNIMHYNLQYNLCKREPWRVFIRQEKGEQLFQSNFFDSMNLDTEKFIRKL